MNLSAYEIVRGKRVAEGPLEPAEAEVRRVIGAKGWNTRGYLPHRDVPGTQQMITFRLADAMPASRRAEWEALFEIRDERVQRTKIEAYLDRGHGSCVFRHAQAAAAVEQVLLRCDGERYRLMAWVIMPNHVHALLEVWTIVLGRLLRAWKGASANAVNRLLGRTGELWQTDYWDRYMRDEAHFRKACRYIESNPVKAGLVRSSAEWPFSSANPKWRWSGPDRYYGAQLVWERGHSCPPVPLALSGGLKACAPHPRADRNVRAPTNSHC
jgi:REP element-mobilizing transposase RayT